MKTKNAQAWGFDVIVAIGMFIFGMTAFFLYTINYPQGEQEKLDDLLYEGNILADNLLSTGSPENWTVNHVSKIGLLTNKVVNQTKLEQFYEISSTEYDRTKALFGIKYDYFVNFSEPIEISSETIEGIGLLSENPNNKIKISRVSLYKNKPVTIEVQVWD